MKSNTNLLRKELAAILSTALTSTTSGIYYLNFPKPATYPYAVFELSEVSTVDGRTSYTLEIDLVSQDIKVTNNMADTVQDTLDHDVLLTTKLFFHSYRSRRYAVVEEDKSIQRVHLQLDLYFYSKEE